MDDDIIRLLDEGTIPDPEIANELETLKEAKDDQFKRVFLDAAALVHAGDFERDKNALEAWMDEYDDDDDVSEDYSTVAKALLGVALRETWRFRDAIETFQSVPEWQETADMLFQVAECHLRMGNYRMAGEFASRAAIVGGDSSWAAIGKRGFDYLDIAKEYVDAERRYFELETPPVDDVMMFPRGWSSTSPFVATVLPDDVNPITGGGYYLRWKGQGVVIDPGIDFLRNFHGLDGPFSITDIDAVLVSHCHLDHVADLPAINSLVWDSEGYLGSMSSVNLYADENTIENYSGMLGDGVNVRSIGDESDEIDVAGGITIQPFQVNHSISPCYGFQIELLDGNMTIGYTADTEYFDQLPESLEGSDVVVAHYSKQYAQDIDDELSEKHLGLYGLNELLSELDPEVFLIGEWSANEGDRRREILDSLEQLTGKQNILPVDRNLQLSLANGSVTIPCIDCGTELDPGSVSGAPLDRFDDWPYLCGSCYGTRVVSGT